LFNSHLLFILLFKNFLHFWISYQHIYSSNSNIFFIMKSNLIKKVGQGLAVPGPLFGRDKLKHLSVKMWIYLIKVKLQLYTFVILWRVCFWIPGIGDFSTNFLNTVRHSSWLILGASSWDIALTPGFFFRLSRRWRTLALFRSACCCLHYLEMIILEVKPLLY